MDERKSDLSKGGPEPEVPLEQIIATRKVSMEKAREFITQTSEEIKYKENQLKTKIVEENCSNLYELVSFPLDHKKPRHALKIEIEILEKRKKKHETNLEVMKELQKEDEGKNASKSN